MDLQRLQVMYGDARSNTRIYNAFNGTCKVQLYINNQIYYNFILLVLILVEDINA